MHALFLAYIIIIIIIIKTLFCITEKDDIKPLSCIHTLQTIVKVSRQKCDHKIL